MLMFQNYFLIEISYTHVLYVHFRRNIIVKDIFCSRIANSVLHASKFTNQ